MSPLSPQDLPRSLLQPKERSISYEHHNTTEHHDNSKGYIYQLYIKRAVCRRSGWRGNWPSPSLDNSDGTPQFWYIKPVYFSVHIFGKSHSRRRPCDPTPVRSRSRLRAPVLLALPSFWYADLLPPTPVWHILFVPQRRQVQRDQLSPTCGESLHSPLVPYCER